MPPVFCDILEAFSFTIVGTVQTVGGTRFVAAITVCYETDTPDLARRER